MFAVAGFNVIPWHRVFGHPLRVGLEVAPHGRHRVAGVAQELQVIGNVAGTTAKFAPELRHEEGDIQHVNLVGQDVRGEAVRKHHDGVVGERAAHEGARGFLRTSHCRHGT